MTEDLRPLSDPGPAQRLAPFAGAALIVLVAAVLPPSALSAAPMALAGSLTVLLVVLCFAVPWRRLPAQTEAVPPLLFFAVVALARDASGGESSPLTALVLLPLFFLALYGGRVHLIAALIALGLTLAGPIILIGGAAYPPSEWHRVLTWLAVAAVVGMATQRLVISLSRRTSEAAGSARARDDAYRALLDSETRHRQLIEGLRDVVFEMDRAGRWTFLSSAFTAWTGRSNHDAVGTNSLDIVHPADREGLARAQAQLLEAGSGTTRVEFRYSGSDDQLRSAVANMHVITDHAGGARIGGTLSDVTDERAVRILEQQQKRTLEAVAAAVRQVGGPDARDQLCLAACTVAEADFAMLMEPEGDRALVLSAQAGSDLPAMRIRMGQEPSAAVVAFTSAQRFFVEDTQGHPAVSQRFARAIGSRSVVFEPILSADAVVAVLVVGWRRYVDEPGGRELAAIGLLAAEAGNLIERADLIEQLAVLSRTDALTGLPNRRHWDEALEHELRQASRQSRQLHVALLDLDHFKRLNDEHGHQAGDRLLKAAAAAWKTQIRAADTIARYGGEEFALAFPSGTAHDALTLVERIRAACPGGLTCSAGIATWDGSESAEALVRRADAALYEAKALGRDRTKQATTRSGRSPANG